MPLQNRVAPFNEIIADPARGLFMGNRGILHDHEKQLDASRWRHSNWVTCSLTFGSRKRTLMSPRSYTELFFMDEPTALVAAHRPCAECRRVDYKRFIAAWTEGLGLNEVASSKTMDSVLHKARGTRARKQVTFEMEASELPTGTMIELDDEPWLIWHEGRYRWTLSGYSDPEPLPGCPAIVLKPSLTVSALSAGYKPIAHHTLTKSYGD